MIRRLTVRESVTLLLQRFLFTAENKELVLAAASVEEALIRAVPVWKLTNVGDLDSTRLAADTLLPEKEHKHDVSFSR